MNLWHRIKSKEINKIRIKIGLRLKLVIPRINNLNNTNIIN